MKVKDLARKLNIDKHHIREELARFNIKLPPKAKQIDDRMASSIITKITSQRKQDAEKIEQEKKKETEPKEKKEVELPPLLSVKSFSERLKLDIPVVIKELMKNGVFASLNETIDFDTASIIADDLGFIVKKAPEETEKMTPMQLREMLVKEQKKGKNLVPRAPIVTIMGHVDHGKTTLLDAIRKTDVVSGEKGGITQSIGAYQVTRKKKEITFLDTPGHEAFGAMRARGANVTDIAVLVVAADDGVRPQTKEAVRLAKAAHVPIIVAINKIDKPNANPDKVKKELGDLKLIAEEYGGDTLMAEISAKQGKGVDSLLDIILLVADIHKFSGNQDRPAFGTVIESNLDNKIGPVITVIIQAGTLKLGQPILVGAIAGKVKAMWDYKGIELQSGVLSQPVRILGLNKVPDAGDVLQVIETSKLAKDMAKHLQQLDRMKKIAKSKYVKIKKGNEEAVKRISGDVTVTSQQTDKNDMKYCIILKGDVQGSIEAIQESINALKTKDVEICILDTSTGDISESDVTLAKASNATILGFNVKQTSVAQRLAEKDHIEVHIYSIIYELLEYVKKQASALLPTKVTRKIVGRMTVLKIFRTGKGEMIVGGKVTSGKIQNGSPLAVVRNEKELGTGTISQLQIKKIDAKEVAEGNECGITYRGSIRIKEGDLLEAFDEKRERQKIK